MNRREFLLSTCGLATASLADAATRPVEPTAAKLPRWRGFNLLEKCYGQRNRPFAEADFALMAEWGFDFARLPLSYRCWSEPEDLHKLSEPVLKQIDDAVAYGKKYGVHVCINFHRAPGYCVNPPAEPFDLWKDDQVLDGCAYQWAVFAERYRGMPNSQISYNLMNEPAKIP